MLPPMLELDTPHGPARAHLHEVDEPRALLVLGHGAGGGVGAPDLVAATRAANAAGVTVALVEQPYRVAGRRSQPSASTIDTAWVAVVEQLRTDLPLIVGGRSAGARVACRTASATGAVAVLCLAFPLISPRGDSREPELDGVKVPVLVVQGVNDRFGMPEPAAKREVVQVAGDHGLKKDLDAVEEAVREWLGRVARRRRRR